MSKTSESVLTEIEHLVDDLSPEQQLRLVEYVAGRLRTSAVRRKPRSLRGIWRGRFPGNPDIDAILHEIRHEWEKEWSEGDEP